MKKYITFLIAILILLPLFTPYTSAVSYSELNYTEKVWMVKNDKDNLDILIKRQNNDLWLIQHNRKCTSMTTEFPIDLIVENGVIKSLKVDFNEECEVYNSSPYSGEGTFSRLIPSTNMLVADHEAEIIWGNKKYLIDYTGSDCKNLRDFVGKRIYFYSKEEVASNGKIIIPNDSGECDFILTSVVEEIQSITEKPDKIQNLDYQGQNNQVYFYWEAPTDTTGDLSYLVSYSKNKLDLKNYTKWNEMPHVILTKKNSYIVKLLENEQKYYFYIGVLQNDLISDWTLAEATPVTPKPLSNAYYDSLNSNSIINNDSSAVLEKSQVVEAKVEVAVPKIELPKYFVSFYTMGKYIFFKSFQSLK